MTNNEVKYFVAHISSYLVFQIKMWYGLMHPHFNEEEFYVGHITIAALRDILEHAQKLYLISWFYTATNYEYESYPEGDFRHGSLMGIFDLKSDSLPLGLRLRFYSFATHFLISVRLGDDPEIPTFKFYFKDCQIEIIGAEVTTKKDQARRIKVTA